MSHWTEDSVLANGLHLHYYRTGGHKYRTGGQKPALVLLHGVTDDGLCWSSVAHALEDIYDVVMIDARGHGKSDPPAGHNDFTTALLVSDAWNAIEQLHLDHPVLMGHSMGAFTVAGVAHDHPREISMLVLEDPPWREQDTGHQEQRAHDLLTWKENMHQMQRRSHDETVAQCQKDNPNWSPADIESWTNAQLRFNPIVFDSGLLQAGIDWTRIVQPLIPPTLLITGDNSRGSIVTPEIAAEALATMRQGTLIRIEGAGHSIHRDQFAPYIQAVRKFLQ